MAAPRDHSARYDELLPAYALGALDGEELRELEEHIAAGRSSSGRATSKSWRLRWSRWSRLP